MIVVPHVDPTGSNWGVFPTVPSENLRHCAVESEGADPGCHLTRPGTHENAGLEAEISYSEISDQCALGALSGHHKSLNSLLHTLLEQYPGCSRLNLTSDANIVYCGEPQVYDFEDIVVTICDELVCTCVDVTAHVSNRHFNSLTVTSAGLEAKYARYVTSLPSDATYLLDVLKDGAVLPAYFVAGPILLVLDPAGVTIDHFLSDHVGREIIPISLSDVPSAMDGLCDSPALITALCGCCTYIACDTYYAPCVCDHISLIVPDKIVGVQDLSLLSPIVADYDFELEYTDTFGGCVHPSKIRDHTLKVHVDDMYDRPTAAADGIHIPRVHSNFDVGYILANSRLIVSQYERRQCRSVTFYADELGNTNFNRLYKVTKQVLQRHCNIYYVSTVPVPRLGDSIGWAMCSHPYIDKSLPIVRYDHVVDRDPTERIIDVPPPFDVGYAQRFVSDAYQGHIYVDTEYDSYQLEHEGFLPYGKYSFKEVKGVYDNPNWDYLAPMLDTPIPRPRRPLLTENLVNAGKRNWSSPELATAVDWEHESTHLLDCFLAAYFVRPLDTSPLYLDEHMISTWYRDTGSFDPDLLIGAGPGLDDYSRYSFSLKGSNVKPDLTPLAPYRYQNLQTIISHPKSVNAIFCPIFREIKRRMLESLRHGVIFLTDGSIADFEDYLSSYSGVTMRPFFLFVGDDFYYFDGVRHQHLEIDMSKYDKSQDRTALLFHCKLMRHFGVRSDIVDLWYDIHTYSVVSDRTVGLKFGLAFQMRSGDANTLFGNTSYLMAVISAVYPVADILNYHLPLPRYDPSSVIGRTYNLEAKKLSFRYGYFASRFVVHVNDRWYLVPDPLKLVVRLGRRDIVNMEHLRLLHISTCDIIKPFSDFDVCVAVAHGVAERYNLSTIDPSFIHSLSSLVDYELFSSLWYIEPGSNIDSARIFQYLPP